MKKREVLNLQNAIQLSNMSRSEGLSVYEIIKSISPSILQIPKNMEFDPDFGVEPITQLFKGVPGMEEMEIVVLPPSEVLS